MLTNYIVNSQKFVLLIDNLKLEKQSYKILESNINGTRSGVLKEIGDFSKLPELTEPTTIVLEPLSKLSRSYKESEIFKFIQTLKQNKYIKQIFLWATTTNLHDNKIFLVPFLHHMADLVVNFKDNNTLTILNKGTTGLVSNKNYSYEVQNDLAIEIKLKITPAKSADINAINPENIGTFKIGNLNENELLAKKSLLLPYEKTTAPVDTPAENTSGGKIIYEPDSDDDFDDEDPDEDLYV